jgi:hypothetical protein
MAGVDLKFDQSGTRLAVTSIDSSLKVFDIATSSSLKTSLLVDSNTMDFTKVADNSSPLAPWKIAFNP